MLVDNVITERSSWKGRHYDICCEMLVYSKYKYKFM